MISGKRVLVAGPMRGKPEFNFPLFRRVADWLASEHGCDVVDPARICEAEGFDPSDKTGAEPVSDETWRRWMRRDLRMLLDCDAVVLLPDWQASASTTIAHVAVASGIELFEVTAGPELFLTAVRLDVDPGGSVLDEAKALVLGRRGSDYGPPSEDLGATAAMWSAYLARLGFKEVLDVSDVCAMMILLKISRAANAPLRDNWVDVCGYAYIAADLG